MPDLAFSVAAIEPAKFAAEPTLYFKLNISQCGEPLPIHSVLLQCQLRIDSVRRNYRAQECERLRELFGEPERWRETLQSLLWTQLAIVVPGFDSTVTTIDLPVSCSFDFNLAATKYFYGLDDGNIPLTLLFSGSIFYRDSSGQLAVDPISWNREVDTDLPVATWRGMMDSYSPNGTWLLIKRQVFDGLYKYKRERGFTAFDQALEYLLARENAGDPQP